LKDTLLEELVQLEVFSRLVRYSAARSKLLRIMASLMASKKMLASRLSENYVSRYGVPGQEEEELPLLKTDKISQDQAALENRSSDLDQLLIYDLQTGASISPSSSSFERRPPCMSIQEPQSPVPSLAELTLYNKAAVEELPAEELRAIDLGLRLGSFLSEAGWMQESITVLACLNGRLKHLPPHKHWLEMRLDCLQR